MRRRLGIALVLLGLAAATHAAPPGDGIFLPSLDLLAVQPMQFDAAGLARATPYRFTAGIVPIPVTGNAPSGVVFGNTSRASSTLSPHEETSWTANAGWTQFIGGDRTSWSPLLRVESKAERLELVPRRHSVWIQWRRSLP
jgi:hypothetical protein